MTPPPDDPRPPDSEPVTPEAQMPEAPVLEAQAAPAAMQAPAQPAMTAPNYAAPAYATPATRPGMVTAAGVLMIVFGAILCIFGVLFLIGGAFVGGSGTNFESQFPGLGVTAGALAGVIIVFAAIFLALGILDIVAGANVFGGRGWARITGIVLAALFAVFGLLGIGNSDSGSLIVSLLFIAANVFIIWALATTGGWFASRAI